MGRVVTIDGPAGAGKSTVARRLAERLGWRFLDTGAMYRVVTLAALRSGIDIQSESSLVELVDRLEIAFPDGGVKMNGEDVTKAIRAVEVTRASKPVADSPGVRLRLMTWQRDFARSCDVVTEGRDQGTLVFPDAFLKYFLTATAEERARRRVADHASRGDVVDFDAILHAQRERDANDAARAIAPMKPAPDALILDSTRLSIDEVVAQMANDVENWSRKGEPPRHGD